MIKKTVIKNGKKYVVTAASWNDDVGPSAPNGVLWMQSPTDNKWYEVSLTGTSASAAIHVNTTPLTWESPGQDFGYQLLLCPQDNRVYQTYLSGSGANVTMSISQTPWNNPLDYKPYLWLQSDDNYFYAVYAKSGSMSLSVDQNSKKWMNPQPEPPAPPQPTGISYTPASATITWTDKNGSKSGDLNTFNSTADFLTVEFIDINGQSLTSLSLGNCLPMLNFLVCNNNLLTSVDISGCPRMALLNYKHNLFTSLDFSRNTVLIWFDLTDNYSLTSLNVTGCTSLTTLNVTGCTSLTSVNASNLVSLTYFNSNDCIYVTSINVSGCTLLTSIHINNNNSLAAFDASNSGLTHLSIDGFPALTSVNLSSCLSLIELDCSWNPSLTSINVSGCNALTIANCYHNDTLPSLNYSNLTSLVSTNDTQNPSLTSINVSGCIALATSYLNNCGISDSNNIDSILGQLDINGVSNGYVILNSGNNNIPTSIGMGYKTNLEGKGWTVVISAVPTAPAITDKYDGTVTFTYGTYATSGYYQVNGGDYISISNGGTISGMLPGYVINGYCSNIVGDSSITTTNITVSVPSSPTITDNYQSALFTYGSEAATGYYQVNGGGYVSISNGAVILSLNSGDVVDGYCSNINGNSDITTITMA